MSKPEVPATPKPPARPFCDECSRTYAQGMCDKCELQMWHPATKQTPNQENPECPNPKHP